MNEAAQKDSLEQQQKEFKNVTVEENRCLHVLI